LKDEDKQLKRKTSVHVLMRVCVRVCASIYRGLTSVSRACTVCTRSVSRTVRTPRCAATLAHRRLYGRWQRKGWKSKHVKSYQTVEQK
jgi:hypothetical protein